MNTCKYCGKPLTLTPEYDTCMECQGRIMREATMPQGAFATNSTQQMITHEEARKELKQILMSKIDVLYDYVKQQEKKDILYGRLFKVCQEYKHTSIGLSDDSEFLNVLNDLEKLESYITEQQAKDKVYEELVKKHDELVRDVKRYFELSHNPKTNTNPSEMRPYIEWANELTDLELHILSKVGTKDV